MKHKRHCARKRSALLGRSKTPSDRYGLSIAWGFFLLRACYGSDALGKLGEVIHEGIDRGQEYEGQDC